MTCNKCGCAFVQRLADGDMVCPICGRRWYADAPPRKPQALVRRIRYGGDAPLMRDVVVTISHNRRLTGMGGALVQDSPACPFCGEGMNPTSLSGIRRDKNERRFACAWGHRISLTLKGRPRREVWL